MINTSSLLENIQSLNSDADRLNEAITSTLPPMKTNILAALIVAQEIHDNTIQTIHLYSAIQHLTSTIREFMSKPSPPQDDIK